MAEPTKFATERMIAASPALDLVNRLYYWSESLRSRGLHAEGAALHEAVTDIIAWRAENGGRLKPKPHRGLMGEVFR